MGNKFYFLKHLFAISFVLMLFVSCGKDENDEPKNPDVDSGDKIEYYVKYEFQVSIPSSQKIDIRATVRTEKGKQELIVPRTWEGIFGPFNELTTLSISVGTVMGNYNPNMTSSRGRISICRGNQPFILKADESFRGTSCTVNYTVKKEDLK